VETASQLAKVASDKKWVA